MSDLLIFITSQMIIEYLQCKRPFIIRIHSYFYSRYVYYLEILLSWYLIHSHDFSFFQYISLWRCLFFRVHLCTCLLSLWRKNPTITQLTCGKWWILNYKFSFINTNFLILFVFQIVSLKKKGSQQIINLYFLSVEEHWVKWKNDCLFLVQRTGIIKVFLLLDIRFINA